MSKDRDFVHKHGEGQRTRVWNRSHHPGRLWQELCLRGRFYLKNAGAGTGKERLTMIQMFGLTRMKFSRKQIADCEGKSGKMNFEKEHGNIEMTVWKEVRWLGECLAVTENVMSVLQVLE